MTTRAAPTLDSGSDILDVSAVIPVAVLDDLAHAVPVATALARGGVRIIEVTLRTDVALAAIERIAAEVPEIVVGAGTVTTPAQVRSSVDAGARFLVTPGSPDPLLSDALESGLPVLAGASTVTEIMRLMERGQRDVKFFPAEASGGAAYLEAVAGPLPDVRFCPTGGIGVENAGTYLQLPNVACVGGSWLTPRSAVTAGDWGRIERLAAEAAALPR